MWIISRDGDYCHKYAETAVVNPSLYRDLTKERPGIVVHCFAEMEKGLRDFIKANLVPDAKLPAPDEAERINKEQGALPPFPSVIPASGDLSYSDALYQFRRR